MRSLAPRVCIFIIAVAACGGGTLMLPSLNQWDGIAALGLALVYSELRKGRDARAMTWLTLAVLAGKPHLALGIALFLVARRPRVLIAAAASGAIVYALTLLVLPLSALAQWFATVLHVGGLIPTSTTIGLSGVTSSALGSAPAAAVIGFAASAGAIAAAAALGAWDGRRVHAGGSRASAQTEVLFTCVTLLSLLGAPHVFLTISSCSCPSSWAARFGARQRPMWPAGRCSDVAWCSRCGQC